MNETYLERLLNHSLHLQKLCILFLQSDTLINHAFLVSVYLYLFLSEFRMFFYKYM